MKIRVADYLTNALAKASGNKIFMITGGMIMHLTDAVYKMHENDGLDFQWEAKQFREDELDATLMTLTETLESLGKEKKTNQTESSDKNAKVGKEKKEEKKDNYLLKSIRRIP